MAQTVLNPELDVYKETIRGTKTGSEGGGRGHQNRERGGGGRGLGREVERMCASDFKRGRSGGWS